MSRLDQLLEEVRLERERQDGKWGGAKHDDSNGPEHWRDMIHAYTNWSWSMFRMGSRDKWRRRMIQVAALALAWVESEDRKISREIGG